MQEVKVYTDGACSKNPGPGGCSCIVVFGEHRKEASAGFKKPPTIAWSLELR